MAYILMVCTVMAQRRWIEAFDGALERAWNAALGVTVDRAFDGSLEVFDGHSEDHLMEQDHMKEEKNQFILLKVEALDLVEEIRLRHCYPLM